MSTRIASFIGWSDTGKTGFIAACAAGLAARGVDAAAVKCVRHGPGLNPPGKDSTRFFEACGNAAVIADGETAVTGRTPPGWDRPYLEALFPQARAILVEGRVVEGAVRVLVGGSASDEAGLKRALSGFDVLVTSHPGLSERAIELGLAVFPPDDSGAFIDRYLLGGSMAERKITVTAGGQNVPMNDFVEETVSNVVLAVLKSLKRIDLDGEIVVTVAPTEKK